MVRAGYDVWFGNSRGNKYNMEHETLTSKDKAFWDFDFEQMGTLDVPATIDYITELTGQPKVGYIAHS